MIMLGWAMIFLLVAFFAAAFGSVAGIAHIVFAVFLVLLIGSLILHAVGGRNS